MSSMTLDRRRLLAAMPQAVAGATLAAALRPGAANALPTLAPGVTDAEAARDEDYWSTIQQAFTVDRGIVNFNNGGVSPSPAVVQDALKRYLDFSNQAPAYTMWKVLEPQKETVRSRLAKAFGCDAEEMAIVRNASEGLQICQLGIDPGPGDEILANAQDYPRMIWTFKQRERRDGVVLRQIETPVPSHDNDEIVELYRRAITPRTKLMLVSHMINITGQILPVKPLVQLAREHEIPVIVDGAHAFAHFPFERDDLDCDYYASSLHKWLFASFGTGLLYVRRDRIRDLWPLMAAQEHQDENIRKFEEIGTHPCANFLSIAEALTFHEGIGPERKAQRLIYLRDRWAERVKDLRNVRLHTSLAAGHACGIATVEIEGIDTTALSDHLWNRHRIFVVPIVHDQFTGLRISPSVYSTTEEVDRFAEVLEGVAKNGLPKSA